METKNQDSKLSLLPVSLSSSSKRLFILILVLIVVAGIAFYLEKLKSNNTEQVRVVMTSVSEKHMTQTVISSVPIGADITSIDFPADYNHVSFAVTANKKAFVVTDGVSGPKYDEIVWGPYFSPASIGAPYTKLWEPYTGPSSPAYMARDGKVFHIILNGKEEGSYDDVDRYSPVMLKDGSVAFFFTRNNQRYVHLRGVDYGPYDVLDSYGNGYGFTVSLDGDHVAYAAQRNGKVFVVLDGKEQKPYGFITEFKFAPNDVLGYFATETRGTRDIKPDNKILIVDGKEISTTPFGGDILATAMICAGSKGDYKFVDLPELGEYGCGKLDSADDKFKLFDLSIYYTGHVDSANNQFTKKYQSVSQEFHPIANGPSVFQANMGGVVIPNNPGGGVAYSSFAETFFVIDGKEGPHFDSVFQPPIASADNTAIVYGAYDKVANQFIKVIQKI